MKRRGPAEEKTPSPTLPTRGREKVSAGGEKRRALSLARPVPRPVKMHWGAGVIVEEAWGVGRYHEPALQLIRWEDGSESVRFCYYSRGRFQRSPLMLGAADLAVLRPSLARCPGLRRWLKRLAR